MYLKIISCVRNSIKCTVSGHSSGFRFVDLKEKNDIKKRKVGIKKTIGSLRTGPSPIFFSQRLKQKTRLSPRTSSDLKGPAYTD